MSFAGLARGSDLGFRFRVLGKYLDSARADASNCFDQKTEIRISSLLHLSPKLTFGKLGMKEWILKVVPI